jgi:hypothetical protein
MLRPVTVPPGRARLIVSVARRAARIAGLAAVTITSGLACTNSLASAGSRSNRPSA